MFPLYSYTCSHNPPLSYSAYSYLPTRRHPLIHLSHMTSLLICHDFHTFSSKVRTNSLILLSLFVQSLHHFHFLTLTHLSETSVYSGNSDLCLIIQPLPETPIGVVHLQVLVLPILELLTQLPILKPPVNLSCVHLLLL